MWNTNCYHQKKKLWWIRKHLFKNKGISYTSKEEMFLYFDNKTCFETLYGWSFILVLMQTEIKFLSCAVVYCFPCWLPCIYSNCLTRRLFLSLDNLYVCCHPTKSRWPDISCCVDCLHFTLDVSFIFWCSSAIITLIYSFVCLEKVHATSCWTHSFSPPLFVCLVCSCCCCFAAAFVVGPLCLPECVHVFSASPGVHIYMNMG